MPPDKLPEPGEFTKIFKRQHAGAAGGADAEVKANGGSGASKAEEPEAGQPLGPAFSQNGVQPAAANEPGEFTRFFEGGLPQQPAKGGAGAPQRVPAAVQRPSSPVSLRALAGDNSGTFTERFGNAPGEAAHKEAAPKVEDYGVHNPRIGPAPDLSKQAAAEDGGLFDFKASVPRAMPSSQSEPGEYTKLFGKEAKPPLARQSAVGQAPPVPMMGDSPGFGSGESSARSLPVVPSAPMQKGPSEFTMVAGGRQGAPAVSGSAEAAASGAGAARKVSLNVNVTPLNPLAAMGGAHMNTPAGPANLHAPTLPPLKAPSSLPGLGGLSEQAKLILFFAVLAILSVILVVALVVTQKS
jgi:hypothetical protein